MITSYNKTSANKHCGKLSGILSIQNPQVQKEIGRAETIPASSLTRYMTLGMSSFSHSNLTFGPY